MKRFERAVPPDSEYLREPGPTPAPPSTARTRATSIADLHTTPFADALAFCTRRVDALREATTVRDDADPLADFACLRCARATGKMDWIRNFPDSPWAFAAGDAALAGNLVSIGYSSRARRTVAVRQPV